MRTGRPTLADVAARAGVSLKTASRALNAEYGVASATAARVREAARALGFRPNQLARSLASGSSTHAVGLIVASVADPFFAALAGAVEDVLSTRDIQLITASHDNDPERQRRLTTTLVERRVDALLVVASFGSAAYLASELGHGLVVVALDRPLDGVAVDTITVDNRAGAEAATRRLLEAGHRRIAALGTDGRLWTAQERLRGYSAALTDAGVPVDADLVADTCPDGPSGQRAVVRMLGLPDPPTAVLATGHPPGRGAIRAMRSTGVELALATFDELTDPDLLSPPPFVVESGPIQLGRTAATMCLERLDGLATPARSVVLPVSYLDSATLATDLARTAREVATQGGTRP